MGDLSQSHPTGLFILIVFVLALLGQVLHVHLDSPLELSGS